MKNRKVVQFLLYPRVFNSLCILYKGTYCVSFKVYNLSEGGTTTHAFPFIVNHPTHEESLDRSYEPASLHIQSNFSYETERFGIVYEEDRKQLRTQGIFRLEYQQGKTYSTYLSCKLLKKIKTDRKIESSLCTRAMTDNSYETVDTQIFRLKQIKRLNHYHRVFFHSSEFFSSVDLQLCTFSQGTKWWKSKSQLSDLLLGYALAKCDPKAILEMKTRKGKPEEPRQRKKLRFQPQSVDLFILECYKELESMLLEYKFWHGKIGAFRDQMSEEIEIQGKRLAPFTMSDLSHLSNGRKNTAQEIMAHYCTESTEETLALVQEEKEALRFNIRSLRQYYSTLSFYGSFRKFASKVNQSLQIYQKLMDKSFLQLEHELILQGGQQRRNTANQLYRNEAILCPEKLDRIPVLLVEGLDKLAEVRPKHKFSLTVFVHGYQGNSFDFQKSKGYLKRFNKNTSVLVVESITKEMEKSIEELGQKVAEEVLKYVETSIIRYDVINFVGFSLGGLLVRASLQHLGQLNSKLGIFVTFSSPHLGISQSENSLVKLGVWFLIKVDKVKNLKELNFQSVCLKDSLLMRMSKCPHISNFKRVVLVSSKDDGFVPLYSTFLKAQLCQDDILELCNNLLSQIKKLQRVEVMFNTEHAGTLDKLTGRRGHIEFLDNHYFLELFFRLYGPLF